MEITMQSFKDYLIEATTLKAEDYEAAIVIGWHEVCGMKLDPNIAGISEPQYEILKMNPKVIETGRRVATALLNGNHAKRGSKAEVYGRISNPISAYWKSFGASNTTPKTDVMIGKQRFSVKVGQAQLMSGGKAESTATFNVAIKQIKGLEKNPQTKKVAAILENFVTASLAPGQLRAIVKSGKNEVVNAGESAHKECMKELGKLFEQSKEFKIAFAREAMSGFGKFGEKSDSAAEFMLVTSHDGSDVQVHSVYDDAYCESIANKMKLQARFKTTSRKIKGEKTGEYNFWSVVSLIVDASDKVKKEGYTPEEVDSINEFFDLGKIATSIKSAVASAFNKMKSILSSGIDSVLQFLGVEVEIQSKDTIDFTK